MTDLRDKINKLKLQAQTTPLGTTCDTRLLFEILDEVEQCSNANPSEELKYINNKITDLEASAQYESIYDLALAYCEEHNPEIIRSVLETRNKNIKQALQRLEAIDNSNPNEALEIIRKCENSNYLNTWYPRFVKDLKTIKQALIKAQEQEKVLDILKSKKYIPLDRLNPRFWNDKETYNEVDLYDMSKAVNKLGKLEDLEQEVGCPLEVLFKALKQDYIYTKSGKHSSLEFGIYGSIWCICYELTRQIIVNDYKKSWWLKADKSE